MHDFLKFHRKYDAHMQWRGQPKNFGGAKIFDTILFGKTLLKAQNDCIF